MYTISIIEDNHIFRTALEKLITTSETCSLLHSYSSAAACMPHILKNIPDLVVVDIELPDKSGIELLQMFEMHALPSKKMICTGHDAIKFIVEAFKYGACGYILKTDTYDEIVNAIHTCLNSGFTVSPEVSKILVQSFIQKPPDKRLEQLTGKELAVLNFLSQGMMYKEIAGEMFISIDTVKKHIKNIYEKLQVDNRTEACNIYNSIL